MCGIVGLYDPKGVARDKLERMSESVAHRGPDAQGLEVHGNFGLAHRRLSIIDLSETANQPMRSACGRYSIVFNGEVYNHLDIAQELSIPLRTASDTEVVLEAFAKWGPAMVVKLNGMFAMAILDTAEHRLFLFRDRMGIKPLFIYRKHGILAFGSELKAITALKDELELTMDHRAVSAFLHLGYIPQPLSIYREVEKFPSGTWAVFDGKNLNRTRYWNPNEQIGPDVISDEQEAKETLKGLLQESVSSRLMSDVPFGTFLSGGIDSSLVTAMAQQATNGKLKTFSIGFDDPKHNEAAYAKQVAAHLGTEHHEYTVTEKDALDLVGTILPQYDEPYADSSAIPTMLVSKMARQKVTMTLSGDGGDELFMGYGAYDWAERLNNPFIHALRRPIGAVLGLGNDRFRRIARMFEYSDRDFLPAHIFSQEQYMFSRKEIDRLLCDNGLKDIQFAEMAETLNRKLSPAEFQALFDLHYYLRDDLLTKVDRASMRYSLETRVPLLDHRVVEFALNLHPDLKKRNGTDKYILKEVLYAYVPKHLFDRPKWGFSIPLARWMQTDLSFLIDENLTRKKVEDSGLMHWSEVRSLIARFRNGHTHLYNRIWLLTVLQMWCAENGISR